jgi:uracil-DNA glycosylase family 4
MDSQTHYCKNQGSFPLDKFHQKGTEKGKGVLLVGESPAPNGWRLSGKACYDTNGKLLATGKRLNQLLSDLSLSVETCGFTELAKCYVGKDKQSLEKCCVGCWPIFKRQIKCANYKLLIILGVKTLKIFNKLCNTQLTTGVLVQVTIDNKHYFVLGIYHPSPINPHGQKKNLEIFGRVKESLLKII